VRTIDELGVPSDAKEAYAFALMGFLTVHGLPGTVPSCTGAAGARVLGSITPGASGLPRAAPGATAPRRLVVAG
jgi:anhydro-N-acetylmuramic acid kinase